MEIYQVIFYIVTKFFLPTFKIIFCQIISAHQLLSLLQQPKLNILVVNDVIIKPMQENFTVAIVHQSDDIWYIENMDQFCLRNQLTLILALSVPWTLGIFCADFNGVQVEFFCIGFEMTSIIVKLLKIWSLQVSKAVYLSIDISRLRVYLLGRKYGPESRTLSRQPLLVMNLFLFPFGRMHLFDRR